MILRPFVSVAQNRSSMSSMTYRVVLQDSEEGFAVSCPGLPGCWSQGATEAEALENIRSAIQKYLEAVYDSLKSERVRDCLLYTSDAADEEDSVDLGGR